MPPEAVLTLMGDIPDPATMAAFDDGPINSANPTGAPIICTRRTNDMEHTTSLTELAARADRMRRWALNAPAPLAIAYRRRACELEFLVAVATPARTERSAA